MRTISEVSDDVFLSPVSTKAPTDFTKKGKPEIPKPYHQYIAEKHQKTDTPVNYTLFTWLIFTNVFRLVTWIFTLQ